METKNNFNYKTLFWVGLGFLGISLLWAIYHAYVPIFLKERFGFNSSQIGLVTSANNLITVILLPIIGGLSDRTRTKLGRRMPFILVGVPLSSICFLLIPHAQPPHSIYFLLVLLATFNFTMALYRSPVVALMPDLTPSEKRSQANGIINLMGGVGALIAYFGGKALYDHNPQYPFFGGAILSFVSSVLLILIIKEPVLEQDLSVLKKKSVFASLLSIRTNKNLIFILTALFCWSVGFAAMGVFFTSYAKFYLGFPESSGGLILGFFALSFIVMAIPAGKAGALWGRKKCLFFGLLSMSVLLSGSLFTHSFILTSILFVLAGFVWALVNVNALPMVIDMGDQNNSGEYTGLYYLSSQFASLVAPAAAGFAIDRLGYSAFIGFCVSGLLLGAIFMLPVRAGESHA